jgi:uncharacterized protein (DUF736 family)
MDEGGFASSGSAQLAEPAIFRRRRSPTLHREPKCPAPPVLRFAPALFGCAPGRLVPAVRRKAALAVRRGGASKMSTIGTFKRDGGNYRGTIKTLTLSIHVELRPATKEHDKSPDFRIHGPHGEFGAAWKRRSSAGRDYLSCKFDDPLFPAPVYGTLVPAGDADEHLLIWTR